MEIVIRNFERKQLFSIQMIQFGFLPEIDCMVQWLGSELL